MISVRLSATLLACAATLLAAAPRLAGWQPPVPLLLSSQFVLSGEVVARTDAGFTLLSVGSQLTTILVNSDTEIRKGAESIRLSDIMPGDKLSATVMRTVDGSVQAVKVEVRTGYED